MKQFQRSQRVAEEIQRIVAQAIRVEVKDYDLSSVTITRCEITRDLGEATVRYSVLGDDDERRACAQALTKVTGFLRSRVGDHLRLRQTPLLRFAYDDSIVESMKMEELFNRLARERENDDEV